MKRCNSPFPILLGFPYPSLKGSMPLLGTCSIGVSRFPNWRAYWRWSRLLIPLITMLTINKGTYFFGQFINFLILSEPDALKEFCRIVTLVEQAIILLHYSNAQRIFFRLE